MAQTYDQTKPESGVTKIDELYSRIRNHQDAVRSYFSGSTVPGGGFPYEHGNQFFDTDDLQNGQLWLWDGSGWRDVGVASTGYLNTTWVDKSISGTSQNVDVAMRIRVEINVVGSPASVADFTNSVANQQIIVAGHHALVGTFTILHDVTKIKLQGGANRVISSRDVVVLLRDPTNSFWIQIANSVNS